MNIKLATLIAASALALAACNSPTAEQKTDEAAAQAEVAGDHAAAAADAAGEAAAASAEAAAANRQTNAIKPEILLRIA